jgi:hypothetical protein
MQYMEGLTDCQAADAVRRCIDWKYVLSLELSHLGFSVTVLHDFRQHLLFCDEIQSLLDLLLSICKDRGWIKTQSAKTIMSAQILDTIRNLQYLKEMPEDLADDLQNKEHYKFINDL